MSGSRLSKNKAFPYTSVQYENEYEHEKLNKLNNNNKSKNTK